MNRFEDVSPPAVDLNGHVLYASPELFPMCLVRLSASRTDTLLYAAADAETGMALRLQELPPFWRELAQRKAFCSRPLFAGTEQRRCKYFCA